MFGIGKKKHKNGFGFDNNHEYYAEHALIERYLQEANEKTDRYYVEIPLKDTEAGAEIAKLSPESLCKLVMAAHERLAYSEKAYRKLQKNRGYRTNEPVYRARSGLYYLQRSILRRKLPFSEAQLQMLLDWFDAALVPQHFTFYSFPAAGIVKALKDFGERGESFEALLPAAERIIGKTAKHPGRDVQKFSDRMLDILGMAPDLPIRPGEAWADAAIEYVGKANKKSKANWGALLAHCVKVSGGKPTKKWAQTAEKLASAVTIESIVDAVPGWFLLVDKPRTSTLR